MISYRNETPTFQWPL